MKYFVVKKGEEAYLPYGYSRLCGQAEKKSKTYLAYANEDALPLGYTYDSWISEKDYSEMSVTEKQQALLQGIVVEDDKIPSALADTKTETEFTDEDISYMITDMHNVELTDQGFTATEKKASVTLSFEGIPESETYFILKGLQFSEEGKTLTQSKSRLHIDVTCGKITKMITFLTRKNNFYSGVDDYLINAGYRDEKA